MWNFQEIFDVAHGEMSKEFEASVKPEYEEFRQMGYVEACSSGDVDFEKMSFNDLETIRVGAIHQCQKLRKSIAGYVRATTMISFVMELCKVLAGISLPLAVIAIFITRSFLPILAPALFFLSGEAAYRIGGRIISKLLVRDYYDHGYYERLEYLSDYREISSRGDSLTRPI